MIQISIPEGASHSDFLSPSLERLSDPTPLPPIYSDTLAGRVVPPSVSTDIEFLERTPAFPAPYSSDYVRFDFIESSSFRSEVLPLNQSGQGPPLQKTPGPGTSREEGFSSVRGLRPNVKGFLPLFRLAFG